ncbi:MAG: transposase, partial [Candidatus Methanomethylophilaceae archaeon]|nr:transposase [Candidatus Methanomethylophilaceae archaeon]
MSRVYIHRPSRENAMSFVCTLGVIIVDVINHVLKENDIGITYTRMVEGLQILFLRYDRERDEEFLSGPYDLADTFLDVEDTLGIDTDHLIN